MAVTDHLKTAATELMRAAELVKQEIESLRKDHTMLKTDIELQIAQRLDNIRSLEHEQQITDDSNVHSQLRSQVQLITTQVANLRNEISDHQREVENAVRQKNGMVDSLEAQARSILP